MSPVARTVLLVLAVVLGCTRVGAARAEDCEQRHSLFAPVPDACLEEIFTDRPHKTDTPAIVAPGHFQAEIGVLEYGADRGGDELAIWNTQLKLGLAEWLELGFFYTPISGPVTGKDLELNRELGARAKLLLLHAPDDHWLITLVPYAEGSHGEITGAGGYLFLGYDFASGLEAELNLGYIASVQDGSGGVIVTTALTQPLVGKLAGFVELFTESAVGDAEQSGSLDTGLLYVLTRDLQLDAGVYWGLYGDTPLATFFLGVSFRI